MAWDDAIADVHLCGVSTRKLSRLSQIKSLSLKVRNARSEVLTLSDKTCYNPPQRCRSLGAVPLWRRTT
jgi:hypothetical protein